MDVAGVQNREEHFDFFLRSEEARQRGFTVESHPKCPTLYYLREEDGVIELHVDEGHGCGKETIVAELLTFLSEKIEMSDCKGSVSPKLDKACIDGDNEELSEEQTSRFRSSVLTLLLYLSNERTDIQSTVRLLCTMLKSDSVGDETVETTVEVRQGHGRHVNCV